jgi:hypothetical protein
MRAVNPSRPPGRRYRRRRPGESVNPQWTAPQLPDGSFASPPPYDGAPLAGVLGETWEQYRRHAPRLLPYSAAAVGVAIGATELIRLVAGRLNPLAALLLEVPAAWLVIKLAEFLLGAVTVGIIHETRAPHGTQPARLRECLGEITTVWLVTSFAVLGGALLLVIPGIYLAIMWSVCVPVIVVERASPLAALGRSRQLIRGHGWAVFGRLVLLSLLQIPVSAALRAVFSWLPGPWPLMLENGVLYVLFIPAAAVLSTLMYYRLTAAEAAEEAVAGI